MPVQRCVQGTREVVTNVTVNRPKCETYTQMVPQQATRWINVPCVEKRVQHVPIVNYVTEMQEKIDYVTEMQEKIDYVTEYVTKQIQVPQCQSQPQPQPINDFYMSRPQHQSHDEQVNDDSRPILHNARSLNFNSSSESIQEQNC